MQVRVDHYQSSAEKRNTNRRPLNQVHCKLTQRLMLRILILGVAV